MTAADPRIPATEYYDGTQLVAVRTTQLASGYDTTEGNLHFVREGAYGTLISRDPYGPIAIVEFEECTLRVRVDDLEYT